MESPRSSLTTERGDLHKSQKLGRWTYQSMLPSTLLRADHFPPTSLCCINQSSSTVLLDYTQVPRTSLNNFTTLLI